MTKIDSSREHPDLLMAAVKNSTSYAPTRKYVTYLLDHGHYSNESGVSNFRRLVDEVARTRNPKGMPPTSVRHQVAQSLAKQFEDDVGWEAMRDKRDRQLAEQLSQYKKNMKIRQEILEAIMTPPFKR